jgi:hypothetical protein
MTAAVLPFAVCVRHKINPDSCGKSIGTTRLARLPAHDARGMCNNRTFMASGLSRTANQAVVIRIRPDEIYRAPGPMGPRSGVRLFAPGLPLSFRWGATIALGLGA